MFPVEAVDQIHLSLHLQLPRKSRKIELEETDKVAENEKNEKKIEYTNGK